MRLFILVFVLGLPFSLQTKAQSRLDTILNIETDRGLVLGQGRLVTVPFYQVYLAAQNTGSSPTVTVTPFAPIALRGIDAPRRSVPGGVRVRFFVDHNQNALLPPRLENTPFVCVVRIMAVQLGGGWELVEVGDVSTGCTHQLNSVQITRPFDDPSNLTHDVTITLDGSLLVPGGCDVIIGTAVLSSPFGQSWNNAFN